MGRERNISDEIHSWISRPTLGSQHPGLCPDGKLHRDPCFLATPTLPLKPLPRPPPPAPEASAQGKGQEEGLGFPCLRCHPHPAPLTTGLLSTEALS